jgi:hypothetical protein
VLVSPSGVLASTQRFDLALVLEAVAAAPVFLQAVLDDVDVTLPLLGCLAPRTLAGGRLAGLCPGLSGAVLPLGTHLFGVTILFADGTTATGGAVWEVLAASP